MVLSTISAAIEDYFIDTNQESIYDFFFVDAKVLDYKKNLVILELEDIAFGLMSDEKSAIRPELELFLSKRLEKSITLEFYKEDQYTPVTVKPPVINVAPIATQTDLTGTQFKSNIMPSYSFDNYFYSYENSQIVTACRQVHQEVTTHHNPLTFNPIFIYGISGIGKTHIVSALGNEILKNMSSCRVLYKNAGDFLNEYSSIFTGGLNTNGLDNFKELYSSIDVLILDDIQMLMHKEGTLVEFFSIFESMRTSNKTVIITSDVSPKKLKFEERLLSRFLSGLVMEIKSPDSDTKIQIFKYHANTMKLNIEEEAINVFIESSKNVRELLGYINKIRLELINYPKLDHLITVNDAITFVENASDFKQILNQDDIINIVCKYYDITEKQLKTKSRKLIISKARTFCIYFIRSKLKITSVQVAKEFGMSDHSSIVKIMNKMDGYKAKHSSDYESLAFKVNNFKQQCD